MEEPLLPALIPNESETTVAHEPLDRTVRHVDNLRGLNYTTLCRHDQVLFHDCARRPSTSLSAEPFTPSARDIGELTGRGVERHHPLTDRSSERGIGREHQQRETTAVGDRHECLDERLLFDQ